MQNISKIIGENIKNLMEKENVSFRNLSKFIGITHPTLIKYVDGEQAIDSEKLMKISIFFNLPFEYFFTNKHDNFSFMFRGDKPQENIQDCPLAFLKDSIINYMDTMSDVNYYYNPQKYYINDKDEWEKISNLIEIIALSQRKFVNIENVIPNNYYEVLQNIGINVVVKDFKNDCFYGVSSFSQNMGSFILINDSDNISEERKIFSLFHEYAHLLFHSDQYSNKQVTAFYANGKYDKAEKIANCFAGYFLMPRNMVLSYINSKHYIDHYEMKQYFKVSLQTLYFMLHEYGLITKNEYTVFWKKNHRLGYQYKEPFPIGKISFSEKNNKLVCKIKDLYFKNEISANKISEVLGIDNIKTRKLLQEWRNVDERYLSIR